MVQRKEATTGRVPKFKNEKEAGEFWDTHSPLDYPDEFRQVEVQFARPLMKRGLTVKLNDDTLQELHNLAQSQGIGAPTLARMWILERLKRIEE